MLPTISYRCLVAAIHLFAAVLLASPPALAADPWADHAVNTWVKQSPREAVPAPGLQYEGSGALDPQSGRWIHFAGHDGIPQGFYLFTCDLADGAWRQWFPNTSPPGVCCVDGANTFDVAHGRFVAFPGGSLGHGYQWSRGVKLKESNVWLYDPAGNAWTNMRPPPYRRPEKYSRDIIGRLNSASTYDANHEVSIAFGGQGAGGPTSALWVYDAYANDLQRLRPPDPPAERDGMGLCYDTRNDCLVMFGSQYSNDERTWIYRYDTNRWEGLQLDPHPPGKKEGTYSTNPKLAFDSTNGVCLCVVRRGEESGLPSGTLETWTLDVSRLQWSRREPAVSPDPGASRARNLSYWPEANVFVLESVAANKGGMQLWTYRYGVAASDPRPKSPLDVALDTASEKARVRWRGDADAARYHVYRAQAEHVWQAKFEKIATVDQPAFEDQPPAGAVSFYRVAAIDRQGVESLPSRIVRSQPRMMPAPIVSAMNDAPLRETSCIDTTANLSQPGEASGDYKHTAFAYVIRAVNQLGVESGPSRNSTCCGSEGKVSA